MKDISNIPYLAVDDIDEEGVWRDSLTGQPLNYTPQWAASEPNGGTRENCGALWAEKDSTGWYDSECSSEKCTVCKIPTNEYFLLRGKVCRK